MRWFNPYYINKSLGKTLGALSIIIAFGLWILLSSTGLVGAEKLPPPTQVAKAFVTLTWSSTEQPVQVDMPWEGLGNVNCSQVCQFEEENVTEITCEVDDGLLLCDGKTEVSKSILFDATKASVFRVFTATLFSLFIGLPVGMLMGASARINAFLSPIVDPMRSAPVVVFMPLFIMWLGIGEPMKISFLILCAVLQLIPAVRDAVIAVNKNYWISGVDLGATPLESVWHNVIPLAKPRIFTAVINSVSTMWTYITVAEYVNADKGLGQLIQNAKRFSAMDQVFVGIFVIIFLSLITYQGMMFIKNKLYPWEGEV